MMKRIYLTLSLPMLLFAVSCTKDTMRYPDGYDSIYYTMYDYEYDEFDNPVLHNTTLEIEKSSLELNELGIKLMSSFEREYDVEVRMYVRNSSWFLTQIKAKKTPGMFTTPDSLAVPGVDFTILDENFNAISPVRTDTLIYYSLLFPKAKKDVHKYYLKSLNNQDYHCPRFAWLSLALFYPSYDTEQELQTTMINNDQGIYKVNTYSKSWLRSIILK